MAVNTDFLKETAYFSGLSPAALDSISKLVFEKRVDRGEIFVLEGGAEERLTGSFAACL